MNIKSLLIGSAAALVAVSGARAADAVMAPEPEPVEYVRVCDAYGAGFFYIPGTETCLKISGYVWYQIATGSYEAGDTPTYHLGALPNQDGWAKSIRARVNFDARSETEWGTLRSYIRLQSTWNGVGDGGATVDQAYIELGGFKMGYSESFWVDSGNGGPSNYGSHSWTGMYYGYQQRALIGYRFDSNGFFGALSLEDDNYTGTGVGGGYTPDVVAKLGYAGGWGAVWAKVGYDESYGAGGALDGFGAQLGAQFNMPNMPGSSLRVIAYYADGDHSYATGGSPGSGIGGGSAEWSVLASYNQQFSETLGVSVAGQYFSDIYAAGTNNNGGGVDGWAAELSVVWFPVKDFEVRTEIGYTDIDITSGSVSGFLRFTRYF